MRAVILLTLIVILLAGGLWFMSTVNTEQPLVRVEKTIPNDRLGK